MDSLAFFSYGINKPSICIFNNIIMLPNSFYLSMLDLVSASVKIVLSVSISFHVPRVERAIFCSCKYLSNFSANIIPVACTGVNSTGQGHSQGGGPSLEGA